MNLPPQLTAFLKRFSSHDGTKHLDPTRDWLLLLALVIIALIASVVWNAWFFFIALEEESTSQSAPVEATPDTNSVEKAQALFELRAAEEARYRNEYRFIDPSR
ncbi:MAG TPA: hypothetical protein PK109_01885 [Candidatus Paceibacterota bacterium]|nr:hypothetical protein [Candidatus Paceibacterota bacterium]